MNCVRPAVISCLYCFAFCEHMVKGSMGDYFRNYISRSRNENHTISYLTLIDIEKVPNMGSRIYSSWNM